jgi:MoaA/NifB/PqqE/SkfB family radical SAM enzyme
MTNESHFNNRTSFFDDFPSLIAIESYLGCNLKCRMCPVPSPNELMNKREHCAMSFDTYKMIIDQVSQQKRSINLTQMGEPLLNPNIIKFISYAKTFGHYVSLTTNGTKLTRELSKELTAAGLDLIIFSFDGGTSETYESIRQGAKFKRVLANIEHFIEQNDTCQIQIHCILSDLTEPEKDKIQALWQNKAQLHFIPLDDWGGKLELDYKFGSKRTPSKAYSRYPCDLLWTMLTISAEGRVIYCCHDYNLYSQLPSIYEKSLQAIWREDVGQERQRHINGRIEFLPCKTCQAWITRPEYINKIS